MPKLAILPLLLILGLAACDSKPAPNPTLEEARIAYAALLSDPRNNHYAPSEMLDAGELLDKAAKAHQDGADQAEVDQLAYLARRNIEFVAQVVAQRSGQPVQRTFPAGHDEAPAREEPGGVMRIRTLQEELQARQAMAERNGERPASRPSQTLQPEDGQIRMLQESLQTRQTERGTQVTFSDVLFDVNSAELKPEGLRDVRKLADFLNAHRQRQVIVEGYTDNYGTDDYNQWLSERRAEAVRDALAPMGVDPQRIAVRGYGKRYPVASNDSRDGRALNRRVEVTISNDDRPVAPRSALQ